MKKKISRNQIIAQDKAAADRIAKVNFIIGKVTPDWRK